MQMKECLQIQRKFIVLGIPVIFLSITDVSLLFVTVLYAGKLGQGYLNGVGLANTIYEMCLVGLSLGYSSVFDTYGPQVFASKNKQELGIILQKCILQGAMLFLIVLGPYYNIVHLIRALPDNYIPSNHSKNATTIPDYGEIHSYLQVEDFREIGVQYLRMTALLPYLDYVLLVMSRYFAVQGKTLFVYLLSVIMFTTHNLFNHYLVTVHGLGLNGLVLASYSGRLVSISVSIFITVYLVRKKEFMWTRPNMQVFRGWGQMLKLGLSGYANVMAEEGVFEISVFCSQFDGALSMSVIVVGTQIQGLAWSVTNGICFASATLIGTSLGRQNRSDVKLNMIFSALNVLVISVVIAAIEFCLKDDLVTLFTSETDVVKLFSETFWLSALFIPVDHLQCVLNRGILTSFGKQKFIAVAMTVICYGIALPIILCAIFFTDLIVSGIYIGFAAFYVSSFIAATIRIYKLDLDDEITKAKIRIRESTPIISDTLDDGELDGLLDVPEPESSIAKTSIEQSEQSIPLDFDNGRKEIRRVLLAIFASFLWFVTLVGISFAE